MLCLCALLARPELARADRIDDLERTLRYAKNEKKRINAAVALGKLKDERGVKPLVWALRKDESHVVRAVAAAALGHIGDPRALPALRKALDDPDPSVRRRAEEAIRRIEKRVDDRAVAAGKLDADERDRRARVGRYKVAPREVPRLAPEFLVIIKSVEDKSKTKRSKKARQFYAGKMRAYLLAELRGSPGVITDEKAVADLDIRKFAVDVTIERFERRTRGPWVEIVCEVRLSVSNHRGRMLSFLTGGATVQVPARTFRPQYEPQLRQEALENAAKGVNADLLAYLTREDRQ